MKREVMSVLFGAALLVPMNAEAQRGRGRDADGNARVEKLEPITTGGRTGHRARPAARTLRVRFDYGRTPIFVRHRARLEGSLNPGELRHVLGQRTMKEIRNAGRRAGLRGAVRGHWIDARRHGLVLVVTMDRVDVAEFIDYDRDGWIDDSFFFHDRGGR